PGGASRSRLEEAAVDQLADDVPGEDVRLLDAGGVRGGRDPETHLDHGRQRPAVAAGQADRPHLALAARLDGAEHARRAAARRDRQRHVAALAERTHLPGEHLLVAVVVGDGGEGGGIGGERHGRERRPFAREAPDELRRDVLGVGRAAAVAEEEDLPSGAQRLRDEVDRALEGCRVLLEEYLARPGALREQAPDLRLGGGRHQPTSGAGGMTCSTKKRRTSRGVMMPTSRPSRATSTWSTWRSRISAITFSVVSNSSITVGSRAMMSLAGRSAFELCRSAVIRSFSLRKPRTCPSRSTTGTPPNRPATRMRATASSDVSGLTAVTRSVMMVRAWPFIHGASTGRLRGRQLAAGAGVPGAPGLRGATGSANVSTLCGRNSVVECQLPKLDVAGSTPVARSRESADFSRLSEAQREEFRSESQPRGWWSTGRAHAALGKCWISGARRPRETATEIATARGLRPAQLHGDAAASMPGLQS